MRIIDRKWTDLFHGLQAVQTLQGQLESEFGRAVEVGYKQKYRRELTEWQKKRRIFFALVVLAPLSIVALCITAFYFQEVACVLAWWLVTVLLVFITLVAAGWSFIRQMVSSQPMPKRARVAANLTDRWWDSLTPKTLTVKKHGDRGEVDFLTLLDRALPDDWLAVRDLLTSVHSLSDTGILLLGRSGIWIFEVKHWSGVIIKQDGVWKQVHRKREDIIYAQIPDEQWTRQRDEILKTIQIQLPHLAWTSGLLQGGVAFSHPKVKLDKTLIRGNVAPFGPARAWVERILQSSPDERFTEEVQLEILDALIAWASCNEHQTVKYESSRDEAERIYKQVAGQLREYVAKMVK